jgi:hypothetical protein
VADPLGATAVGEDLQGRAVRLLGHLELEPVRRFEQRVRLPRLFQRDGPDEGPLAQALDQERIPEEARAITRASSMTDTEDR